MAAAPMVISLMGAIVCLVFSVASAASDSWAGAIFFVVIAAVLFAFAFYFAAEAKISPFISFASRWGQIACPRCGFVGPPHKIARGFLAVGCLLMLLFVIPGLIYLIVFSGYQSFCPRCGMRLK